jgi:hypothetical protein
MLLVKKPNNSKIGLSGGIGLYGTSLKTYEVRHHMSFNFVTL